MRIQHTVQHIAGLQECIDHRRSDRNLGLADAIQQGFQHMGHYGHVGEAEGATATLNRMRGAENRIQLIVVRCGEIQPKQQALHVREMLR